MPRCSGSIVPRNAAFPTGPDDEERLTADIVELARQFGRYGYRKIAELLRAQPAGLSTTSGSSGSGGARG